MTTQLGAGEALHLRLFLEGVEVPVISASVSGGEGRMANASIDIVATDRALRLLPRTVVHLFYLDYPQAEYGKPVKNPNELYKLLFCGELFSIGFSKTGPGSRAITLSCLDFSNLWDTTYTYTSKYRGPVSGNNEIIGNTSQFYGIAEDFRFDDIISQPELSLSALAESPAHASTQGALGGLLRILETVGGIRGKYRGANDWVTITEARIRLMDQVGTDNGSTARKVYDGTSFENFVTQSINDRGETLSYRDLIGIVLQTCFYDVVSNPVAHYSTRELSQGERLSLQATRDQDPGPVLDQQEGQVAEADISTLVFSYNGQKRLSEWMHNGKVGVFYINDKKKAVADQIELIGGSLGWARPVIAAAIINGLFESALNPLIQSFSRPADPADFVRKFGPEALLNGRENSVGIFQLFAGTGALGFGMSVAERQDITRSCIRIGTAPGMALLRDRAKKGASGAELTSLWTLHIEKPANKEREAAHRALYFRQIFPDGIGS